MNRLQALGLRRLLVEQRQALRQRAALPGDERAGQELAEIELALTKGVVGLYGLCESCELPIESLLLRKCPTARLCLVCAGELEEQGIGLVPAGEVFLRGEVDARLQGLDDGGLFRLVSNELSWDGPIRRAGLSLSVRRRILWLEGRLPDREQHRRLLNLLAHRFGFTRIVDLLEVGEGRAVSGQERASS